MQGSTKTVGGGAATPTADAYNKFLQGQLGSGGNMNTALQSMLNGQGPKIDTSAGMANMPGVPSFQNTNFNPNQTNLDLSQFNGGNVMAGMPSFSDVQGMMGSTMSGLGGNFSANTGNASMDFLNSGKQNFGVGNVNMPSADVNSPRAMAIKNIIDRQNAMQVAGTRARFGGLNARSSGASLAEAQSNAEGQDRLLAGLQGVTQQDIGNTLQFGQLNTSNQLQGQGLQSQDMLSRLGLTNQNMLGNRQISSNEGIASANNALQAAMAKAQFGGQGMGQLLNYAQGMGGLGLQQAGLGAQNTLNAANFNQQGNQLNNSNMFNQNTNLNNFNQQMFGQQSSNTLNNQQMGNQFGLGQAQLGQQGMSQALQMLFSGMNGSNQLGTPQAQTVQTPSMFSQITNGLGQIAPLIAAPFTGGASLAAYGMPGMGGMGGGGGNGMNSQQMRFGTGLTPQSIGLQMPQIPGVQSFGQLPSSGLMGGGGGFQYNPNFANVGMN